MAGRSSIDPVGTRVFECGQTHDLRELITVDVPKLTRRNPPTTGKTENFAQKKGEGEMTYRLKSLQNPKRFLRVSPCKSSEIFIT
jgi:hypothetical protein